MYHLQFNSIEVACIFYDRLLMADIRSLRSSGNLCTADWIVPRPSVSLTAPRVRTIWYSANRKLLERQNQVLLEKSHAAKSVNDALLVTK